MPDVTTEKNLTFAEVIKEYGLNDEQVEFYQAFSRKRSATHFEKEASKLIGKPEMIKDWEYNGYHDTGARGNGTCSLGHKLRYAHRARNIKTNEIVVFGIKCVTDFFQLTPLALKLIRQGFNEANNEIKESLGKIQKYKTFEEYNAKTDIVNRANYVMENAIENLMRCGRDKFEESLVIGEMMGFLSMKLPVPNWFEWQVSRVYSYEMRKLNSSVDNDPIYKDSVAKAKKLIVNSNFKTNHSQIFKTISDMLTKLRQNSSMSPSAKLFFDRLINVDWITMDPIVTDLRTMSRKDFKNYADWKYADEVTSKYEQYGVTEKQAAVLKKIHKSYNKQAVQIDIQQPQLSEVIPF